MSSELFPAFRHDLSVSLSKNVEMKLKHSLTGMEKKEI